MRPVSPSAQLTVTSMPSFRRPVASPQPTTAGMPSSRAMIAAWQVRPPRLVTMALARRITGSPFASAMSVTRKPPAPAPVGDDGAGALHHRLPVRVGHVGHQHIAGLDLADVGNAVHQAHRAGAD